MDELAVDLKGYPPKASPRIVEVFSHLEVIEDLHDFFRIRSLCIHRMLRIM